MKYLYFYKFNDTFSFYGAKDHLDHHESFDALISEVDLKTWQSDSKNYPGPQFPLPKYIIEGFRGYMYKLLKESADHSYECLTKKNLKASIALFMLHDYEEEDVEEYELFFKELKEIKHNFNCLKQLLQTIDNIDDFYKFKISIIPEKQPERIVNEISIASKTLLLDNNLNLSISSIHSDDSTQSGFLSNED